MKTKPILFSGPMVIALLRGRKTQTRRVAKSDKPPYQKGQHLWVKETWQSIDPDFKAAVRPHLICAELKPSLLDPLDCDIAYRADWISDPKPNWKWRSPLFMMEWMSRIQLEVVDIYKEDLFEIYRNPEDATAEGIQDVDIDQWRNYLSEKNRLADPVSSFASLWRSINGSNSWKDQPVWVIKFKVTGVRVQS